jgi:hypothetical protein
VPTGEWCSFIAELPPDVPSISTAWTFAGAVGISINNGSDGNARGARRLKEDTGFRKRCTAARKKWRGSNSLAAEIRSSRKIGREAMSKRDLLAAFLSIAVAATLQPASAADVTQQRLMNAASEPQNWLMVHRDYDNSRHSSLREVNRDTAKDLKLKFLVSIGGRSTGGVMRGKEESTPLVDDGFLYVSDTWSRVMKFDVRSGTEAIPLWRYDPKITRARTSRGLAMYANKILSRPTMRASSRSIGIPAR